jgi:hypothetical protein
LRREDSPRAVDVNGAANQPNPLDTRIGCELDGPMPRRVLMIEVDARADVEQRVVAALPDAQLWGEVDPVEAAMLVMERELAA